nr:hypothetical protein [Tanacetum cinerariifolium]
MFIDEQVKSEYVDVASNVSSSAVKTIESKVESVDVKNKGVYNTVETKPINKNNFSPSIIKDWISDDERTKDNIAAGPKDSVVDAGKKATEVDASQVSNNGGQDTRILLDHPLLMLLHHHINAAGTPASTNAFEGHPFERFSPFKNAFSLPYVHIVTLINDTGIFGNAYDDKAVEEVVDMNNVVSFYTIPDAPLTKFLKDYPKDQVTGSIETPVQIRQITKLNEQQDPSWVEAMQDELLQFQLLNVWTLVDLPKDKWEIGTKWGFRNKKDERGIVIKNKSRLVTQGHTQEECIDFDKVFEPIARIEAIRLFLAYASFKDFLVYQMDVKGAFLYEKIEEEVHVCQPPSIEDLDFPNKVYKGKIDKTLFIKIHIDDILLVQVYVDDIIFGSTKKELSYKFESLMHDKFQMSSMRELSFFLRLQVQQKSDGIFISQDKYVADMLKKFNFSTVKTASTLMEPNKALVNDAEAEDVDVYLYRSMIGSLMYLTTSLPDITFVVCDCARFEVTPKTSHLHAVKRIFRYFKVDVAQTNSVRVDPVNSCPKLIQFTCKTPALLKSEANNSDSDYAGAILDKKSITDETIYKEWEDRIERATTTASSLEAEQDSGNINRTQYMATLNEALPQRTGLGSGPRYALTMNPTVYVSCVKQFWTTAKVKKVNDQEHIQALVDKQKVIITKESIRRDLKFDDVEVFLDKQVEEMAKYKEIYVISSHTKKVFANIRRQGQGFSMTVTPLFETMMVNAQEEKKIKPKRKQRQAVEVHSPSSKIHIEESIPTSSNDPLPSGEDSIQLNKLMIFYTNLQQQVHNLEEAKIAQAKDIAKLKKRVKKLEKRRKSRPAGLRRLKKVGLRKQVESSEEKDSLGAQEDASKQGRSIEDIDQDVEIALVNEAQGRMHDANMFGIDDLEGNEVIIDVKEKIVEKEVSIADAVTIGGEVVTTASVEDSVAPTTSTTADVDAELTLAKTLTEIKAAKPKVISTAITTPKAKAFEKKEKIPLDEEVAKKLEAKMRDKMEEEERIAREKDQENRAMIEEWDDVEATIDADRQLTEQIQAQEREKLSIEERSKLLAE